MSGEPPVVALASESSRSPRSRVRRFLRRADSEERRDSGTLELFFDLVFVIAVAFASANLYALETRDEILGGIVSYLMVLFAIWWAWIAFTRFETAFDLDDWLTRILTIVQMAGVLVLAAGTEPAMQEHDFGIVVLGYAIMRVAIASQWLRAAVRRPELRGTALRYVIGVIVAQAVWVAWWLAVPTGLKPWLFLVVVAVELAVPVWAERPGKVPQSLEHLAARFGLFVLILLGQCLLATAKVIIAAFNNHESVGAILNLSLCSLVIVACMWWAYFARPQQSLTLPQPAFLSGYLHFGIFAAIGSLSAGFEVALDAAIARTSLAPWAAAMTVTVPVAAFLLALWALVLRDALPVWAKLALPVAAAGVLASSWGPHSLAISAAALIAVVAVLELGVRVERQRAARAAR